MNNWKQFLTSQGGRADAADAALIRDFGAALTPEQLADGFVAVVGDQGLIAASGDDAADFLHKQLTNDTLHLGLADVRLAGYCSPKGRLLASFVVWRDADAIYLQLPRAIQPALQKRLQMFIMRAKAKLADASDAPAHQVVLGLGGARAPALLATLFPVLPASPYSRVEHAGATLLRLADGLGAPRFQWLGSAAAALALWPTLAADLAVGGNDAWQLCAIHAGVPHIGAGTQEQFVPQMINLELLGGVNFKKGCYPGQEIVARSQYLGKLKRRAALVSIAATDAPAGAEVFAAADPDQPCGMVVNSAPNGHGGVDALVEMKLAAIEGGQVRLGSADGAPLSFLPMPYALDALEL